MSKCMQQNQAIGNTWKWLLKFDKKSNIIGHVQLPLYDVLIKGILKKYQ